MENELNLSRGSRIAKQGFANEKDMVKVFNSWESNPAAKMLLSRMGHDLENISSVIAKKVPGTVKPDIMVSVVSPGYTEYHRISCKRVEKKANYNHLCRKSVSKYADQWGFDEQVGDLLKAFTGEIPGNNFLRSGVTPRDHRRLFMHEMNDAAQACVVEFFQHNVHNVVKEIFLGTDRDEIPQWMLFTYIDETGDCSYHIYPMQQVVDFYTGDAQVSLTSRGNLSIGKVTLQRKGGTGNPFDMQFKFRPRSFLEKQNEI